MKIIERSSPNCGMRRGGALPALVVLHYTAMLSAEAALERLCDPATQVSAHYLVAEDGRVWRLVAEAERAWHAGVGSLGRGRGRQLALDRDRAGQRRAARGFSAVSGAADAGVGGLVDAHEARWDIPQAG